MAQKTSKDVPDTNVLQIAEKPAVIDLGHRFEDWAHIKITEKALSEELDAMVASDMSDRSKFIRRLIRQEWLRRTKQVHWIQAQNDPSEPLAVEIVNPVAVS